MAKTLTASTTAEKDSNSTTPINIIKFEFGGSVGTKYYSDRDITIGSVVATEKVTSWGNFKKEIKDNGGEIGSFSIDLEDADRTIWDYGETIEFQAKNVTLYQHFSGNLEADLEEIFCGVIAGVAWQESECILTFDIAEKNLFYNKDTGQSADRANFPDIAKDQENENLPIIIGYVEKVKSVLIETGRETVLSVALIHVDFQNDPNSVDAIVEDSKEFEQETALDLWVDTEYVVGSFFGRKLTITEREKDIVSSHTTADSTSPINFRCNLLVPTGSYWVGLTARIATIAGSFPNQPDTVDRGIVVFRPDDIYFLDQPNTWWPGLVIPGSIVGTNITIYGAGGGKAAGSIVREKRTSYTWCFNLYNSTAIENVVVKGQQQETEAAPVGLETWLSINESYYSTDFDDDNYEVKNLTTLEMGFLPAWNPSSNFSDNVLYADVTGLLGEAADSPSGNTLNPAAIIKAICINFLGMVAADINTTSFESVASSVDWLKISFAYSSKITGLEFIYSIAFQSRIQLFWEQGKLNFKYLENKTGTSQVTITNTARILDSYMEEEENRENIITRVVAKWIERGEWKQKELIDTDAETLFGKHEKELVFWAHYTESYAVAVAQFYLNRWSKIFRKLKISTFLNTMELERGDWITLTIEGKYTSQKAEIVAINQVPGSGIDETIDIVELELKIPITSGCLTSCELEAELGCDSSCETVCMTALETDCSYACETFNQEPCNLICVSACQLTAVTCQYQCQTNCQEACELDCEEGCEASGTENGTCSGSTCQTACELACQAVCQLAEQATCTESCEQDCMYACTTHCQGPCDGVCTVACTTSCKINNYDA